jgi:hypothetical protein
MNNAVRASKEISCPKQVGQAKRNPAFSMENGEFIFLGNPQIKGMTLYHHALKRNLY